MFWENEEYGKGLGTDIVLDGVVCVVDAVYGLKVRLSISNCACPQSSHDDVQQMEEDHAVDGIGESLRSVNSNAIAPTSLTMATKPTDRLPPPTSFFLIRRTLYRLTRFKPQKTSYLKSTQVSWYTRPSVGRSTLRM